MCPIFLLKEERMNQAASATSTVYLAGNVPIAIIIVKLHRSLQVDFYATAAPPSGRTMYKASLLLVAAAVLAFHCADAQFSFSLPGNWGNGKRAFSFALPGKWGNVKRGGKMDCSDLNPDTILNLYRTIQVS